MGHSRGKFDINVLELLTIVKAVDFLDIRNKTLVIWPDNQVAICVILPLGSHSPDIQKVAADPLVRMIERNISL